MASKEMTLPKGGIVERFDLFGFAKEWLKKARSLAGQGPKRAHVVSLRRRVHERF